MGALLPLDSKVEDVMQCTVWHQWRGAKHGLMQVLGDVGWLPRQEGMEAILETAGTTKCGMAGRRGQEGCMSRDAGSGSLTTCPRVFTRDEGVCRPRDGRGRAAAGG